MGLLLSMLVACEPAPVENAEPLGEAPAALVTEQAAPADALIESMGVALHLRYWGQETYDAIFKPALRDLGIRYVRDGGRDTRFFANLNDLARTLGIRSTLVMDPRDNISGREAPSVAILPVIDSVIAVEGPNEWDVNGSLTYEGQPFPVGVRNYQSQLYSAVKGFTHTDPTLQARVRAVTVLTPSMANPYNGQTLGKVPADMGNMHSYTGALLPDQDLDTKWLPETRKMLERTDAPIVATETGWCNDTSSTTTCTGQGGVSERATAKYVPRMYLEYFRRGIHRCHVYNLSLDSWSEFLRADGSRRPAFEAVRSLISLLADPGPAFPRGSLTYQLTGDLTNVRSLLLQKRDGRFFLALWLNAKSYEKRTSTQAGFDLESSRNVTLTLGTAARSVRTFLPSFQGTTAQATFSNVSTVNLTIPDHVLLVEITPGTVTGGQPDLVVTGVQWSPAAPAAGQPVTFSAVIKNAGSAATPAGVVHGVAFSVDGTLVSWSDTSTLSLAPGESRTVTATGGPSGGSTWTATLGAHQVRAHVDDINRIPNESNEANNTLEQPLTIVDGKPDLVVTDIQWSPASPTTGQAVTFSAVIKNAGTAPTPAGVVHGVAFYVDGTFVSWSDNSTLSLAPGESRTVTATGGPSGSSTWTRTAGSHTVRAEVDDINRIPNEASETNNSFSKAMP